MCDVNGSIIEPGNKDVSIIIDPGPIDDAMITYSDLSSIPEELVGLLGALEGLDCEWRTSVLDSIVSKLTISHMDMITNIAALAALRHGVEGCVKNS